MRPSIKHTFISYKNLSSALSPLSFPFITFHFAVRAVAIMATCRMATCLHRWAFTFIVILSTIPILFSGYYLSRTLVLRRGDPTCDNPRLEWDVCYSSFLVIMFSLAFICTICRVKTLRIPRLTLQIALLVCLGTVIVFIFVATLSILFGGTNAEDSKRIESYYRLDNYAPWAVKLLLKDNGWTDFRNCLNEKKICERKLDDNYYFEVFSHLFFLIPDDVFILYFPHVMCNPLGDMLSI